MTLFALHKTTWRSLLNSSKHYATKSKSISSSLRLKCCFNRNSNRYTELWHKRYRGIAIIIIIQMVKTMMAWILMGTIQLIHRYLCGHKFITRVAILSLKVVAMRKKKRKKHVLWHPLSQIYRRLKHLSKSLNVCKFSSKLFLSNGSKLSARWLTKKSS